MEIVLTVLMIIAYVAITINNIDAFVLRHKMNK